jgi:hypothetical protein
MSQPSPSGEADRGFAWNAATFAAAQPFVRVLSAAELGALDAVAAQDAATRHEPADPGAAAGLPLACDTLVREMRDAVARGPGFILLRGLPFERWGVDASRWVAWQLANVLGTPVSQTAKGARLVDVRDLSRQQASPRQFSTSQELRLHTDPASDLIGLACVRAAASGGDSVLASAVTVHDEMQRQRPDLLQELYDGFHWHRFNEGRPQDAPFSEERVPVFAAGEGGIACRYVRSPIVAGHKEASRLLTDRQVEALDLFDRLASSPQLRITFRMDSGDIVWMHNTKVLHARTQFVDHAEPLPPRHLFRLWLAAPADTPRAPACMNYFNGGSTGIPVTGGQAAYDMDRLWNDPASGGVAKLGVSAS